MGLMGLLIQSREVCSTSLFTTTLLIIITIIIAAAGANIAKLRALNIIIFIIFVQQEQANSSLELSQNLLKLE